MRIGVVSDTHIPEAGEELPEQLFAAFEGCELILHCGDLHSLDVVDWLEELAPTFAARGNGDTFQAYHPRPGVPEDSRVEHARVLEVEGFRIGLTHDLELHEGRPDDFALGLIERVFGEPVDIAVSGHTHIPLMRGLEGGAAILNPGSPTMPYGYLHTLGTVATLEVERGAFEFTVVDLPTSAVVESYQGPRPGFFWKGERPPLPRR